LANGYFAAPNGMSLAVASMLSCPETLQQVASRLDAISSYVLATQQEKTG